MKFIQFKNMIFNMVEFKRVQLLDSKIHFVFYCGEYSLISDKQECKLIFACFSEFLNGNHLFPIYTGGCNVFDFDYVRICLSDKEK